MAQPTETSGAASEATPAEGELKRGLSARHMQMIAIGGAIGTGLFVASGKTISTAGPGGAILAYALIGVMVLFLMQSLGEMAAHLPVPGAFQTYAARYVSPSFGFAMGWNYWFNWAITVAAELAGALGEERVVAGACAAVDGEVVVSLLHGSPWVVQRVRGVAPRLLWVVCC